VPPRFVVFVLPPEKIDVDLAHQILEMATRVDDDPFVDFEYGFVTGRDGRRPCASSGASRPPGGRDFGTRAGLLFSWEGAFVPAGRPLSALKALGFSGKDHYVKAKDAEEVRHQAAREGLDCQGQRASCCSPRTATRTRWRAVSGRPTCARGGRTWRRQS